MIRQGYNHFDSRKNREYISEQDIELLTYIKKQSKLLLVVMPLSI